MNSKAKESGEASEWFLPQYEAVGVVIEIVMALNDEGPKFSVGFEIALLTA